MHGGNNLFWMFDVMGQAETVFHSEVKTGIPRGQQKLAAEGNSLYQNMKTIILID